MLISALNRKLLRDVGRLRGQVLTIALVLAGGITSFIGLRGTYAALLRARDSYYDRERFAHVFVLLERAPESIARRIEVLPGVASVQTRISKEVLLPIEGRSRPASGRLLSLPAAGEPATNAIHLRSGRLPERDRDDEVVVLEAFATAHGLEPGHHVPAVINGKLRKLRVVGVALSPEFIYALKPGSIAEDAAGYAILWMNRAPLAAAYELEGAFNEASLLLQPGASEPAVCAALDRLLLPYGGDGAIGRKDQQSNKILTGELAQLEALAGMVPMIFLGVAAFLVNMVLGRLVTLQRPEIATLKAIGYGNHALRAHYAGLVAVVLVPGTLLGLAGGWWMGDAVLGLYTSVFRFPEAAFQPSFSLVATGILMSGVAALAGALAAVRAAVRLPPAEAMRPPSPALYRKSLVERLRLSALVGPAGMMIVREVERRPLRTLLSSLGIAGALALVVLGRFGIDSLDSYLESTLRREQRQDLAVSFDRPVSPRALRELAAMPGVRQVEGVRAMPVRIRHLHRTRDTVLIGLPAGATLRRLVERGGREVGLPPEGILVTSKLGEVLGLRVGDRAEVEIREGARPVVRPVIAGFVDESVGLQLYAREELVARLEGDLGALGSALLTVDPLEAAALQERLRRVPRVIDVSEVREDTRRLRDMNASMMNVWTTVAIVLAATVIFGVVYNNARIALATRARDLASLRVLGFSRHEISWILIGSMAIELAIAIPIGLYLGLAWGRLFMRSVDQEQFRWEVFVAPSTYLMAAAVGLLAAAASALWVRRNVDRLDLIGVLKTRE
ncbi:ABC transporter permease [Anaeromyxobacter sp. SG17]|uniref:ABC transporter permease n=1 Tax=Anaeromyxobacter sp. SG17 TaxID=2925405 RepID=UPI001F5761C0|nr:FtsX-like permease family protein [Anaeromyxobacter sp. SG17]